MKRGTPEHPKVHALAAVLNVPRYAAVGILESLWHFAQEYAPGGDIGRFPDDAIARWVCWDGASTVLIEALHQSNWIDRCPCHRLRIHDWPDHADQTVRRVLDNRGQRLLACYDDPSTMLAPSQLPCRAVAVPSLANTKPSQAKETDTPPAPKGEPAFGRFVEVFNAVYDRRVRKALLTKAEKDTLRGLVGAYGEAGACCLPLLAWAHDKQQGGGERLKQRVVSHLLRDGSRGTFQWSTLLERADSLLKDEWQYTRRVWKLARQFGLEQALEGFGAVEPPPQVTGLTAPRMSMEESAELRRRILAEDHEQRKAALRAEGIN